MPAKCSPVSSGAADDSGAGSSPLFVVTYADDAPYQFRDGTRMRFGRDDAACEIPVWEQLTMRALSKVAGELWCVRGQMWARNLSGAHELVVSGAGGSHVLPARVGAEPGHACSVPGARGTVAAPSTGPWKLQVLPAGEVEDDRTLRLSDIPDRHLAAAQTLCAPLLAGSTTPATYAEIAAARGWTERVARRRVEELCAHYQDQIEALPGGQQRGETLTQAVARNLVARNKFTVPGHPAGADHRARA